MDTVEEKISLYSDDTLLFLTDVSSSLPAALQIVNDFGSYYGVKIILDKSLIYPLHSRPAMQTPLVWVGSGKYLEICIGGPVAKFYDLNLLPLLTLFAW